ncbi:hypothetical protein PHLGIDRAFT_107516 [Phlebiopsis gigantea 11061_1 CR5-6]|uniref:Uncharacterized protein n=1 Tax=Phlebiopsis gigantea (strain 11061_1 CR5-6) TaxID=745531 RepID=A0A0C3PIY2_PHLG1|nr:hypothetical protein PHLGIDRAFT_107516 [Phlebiopsis gigantea 11061_1 CR5-6]
MSLSLSPSPSLDIHRQHSSRAPVRAPTLTHHASPFIALPSPDSLTSIVSGAHYAGGFTTPPHHEHTRHDRKRRTLSISGDDPTVFTTYHDVLEDLENLFCGAATPELFERRFRHDSRYEDPLCKCIGITECVAQFVALSKLCSSSKRISCRVLSATMNPNKIVLAQTQEYKLRWIGKKKVVESFIVVDLDDDFKIVEMVDQWNGEHPSTGWFVLQFRRLNAKVMPWIIHMPHPRSS